MLFLYIYILFFKFYTIYLYIYIYIYIMSLISTHPLSSRVVSAIKINQCIMFFPAGSRTAGGSGQLILENYAFQRTIWGPTSRGASASLLPRPPSLPSGSMLTGRPATAAVRRRACNQKWKRDIRFYHVLPTGQSIYELDVFKTSALTTLLLTRLFCGCGFNLGRGHLWQTCMCIVWASDQHALRDMRTKRANGTKRAKRTKRAKPPKRAKRAKRTKRAKRPKRPKGPKCARNTSTNNSLHWPISKCATKQIQKVHSLESAFPGKEFSETWFVFLFLCVDCSESVISNPDTSSSLTVKKRQRVHGFFSPSISD